MKIVDIVSLQFDFDFFLNVLCVSVELAILFVQATATVPIIRRFWMKILLQVARMEWHWFSTKIDTELTADTRVVEVRDSMSLDWSMTTGVSFLQSNNFNCVPIHRGWRMSFHFEFQNRLNALMHVLLARHIPPYLNIGRIDESARTAWIITSDSTWSNVAQKLKSNRRVSGIKIIIIDTMHLPFTFFRVILTSINPISLFDQRYARSNWWRTIHIHTSSAVETSFTISFQSERVFCFLGFSFTIYQHQNWCRWLNTRSTTREKKLCNSLTTTCLHGARIYRFVYSLYDVCMLHLLLHCAVFFGCLTATTMTTTAIYIEHVWQIYTSSTIKSQPLPWTILIACCVQSTWIRRK